MIGCQVLTLSSPLPSWLSMQCLIWGKQLNPRSPSSGGAELRFAVLRSDSRDPA